jgi:hypothetical protein
MFFEPCLWISQKLIRREESLRFLYFPQFGGPRSSTPFDRTQIARCAYDSSPALFVSDSRMKRLQHQVSQQRSCRYWIRMACSQDLRFCRKLELTPSLHHVMRKDLPHPTCDDPLSMSSFALLPDCRLVTDLVDCLGLGPPLYPYRKLPSGLVRCRCGDWCLWSGGGL